MIPKAFDEFDVTTPIKNIYVVTVKDRFDRAMLFCRVQEYYESSSNKFKGNPDFHIFDYVRWYSKRNNNVFSYASDWSGFNFPAKAAHECYLTCPHETAYDYAMMNIVHKIMARGDIEKAYIIGTDKLSGELFRHEMAHGLFYTNDEYRKLQLENINALSKKIHSKLAKALKSMGYHADVIPDEIQAYMSTGMCSELLLGQELNSLEKARSPFKRTFTKFHKIKKTR